MVPWGCLRFVIVVFPDHTHLLFLMCPAGVTGHLHVQKPDGTYRLSTDCRKVNGVTKTDSFPIPRIDECIDKIEKAKYVTKFD